jgi:hypothetical protein
VRMARSFAAAYRRPAECFTGSPGALEARPHALLMLICTEF